MSAIDEMIGRVCSVCGGDKYFDEWEHGVRVCENCQENGKPTGRQYPWLSKAYGKTVSIATNAKAHRVPKTKPEMLWELLPRASHILPRRIFGQCMDRLLSGPEGLLDALAAAWLRKERDDT